MRGLPQGLRGGRGGRAGACGQGAGAARARPLPPPAQGAAPARARRPRRRRTGRRATPVGDACWGCPAAPEGYFLDPDMPASFRALTCGGLCCRQLQAKVRRIMPPALPRASNARACAAEPGADAPEAGGGRAQVPLAGGDAALAALAAWEARLPAGAAAPELPPHVERARAKAAAAAAARRGHEAAVAPGRPADADLLAAYMAYIRLEEVWAGEYRASMACAAARPWPAAGMLTMGWWCCWGGCQAPCVGPPPGALRVGARRRRQESALRPANKCARRRAGGGRPSAHGRAVRARGGCLPRHRIPVGGLRAHG
jgi:hypothetical protein